MIQETARSPLGAWESYYVIVGSSAAALTGLQFVVIGHSCRRRDAKMVVEDWTWHVVLPLLAYIAQVVAAATLRAYTLTALFAIAGSALLLVYIGIHNAWDTTTWVTAQQLLRSKASVGATGTAPQPTSAAREPT